MKKFNLFLNKISEINIISKIIIPKLTMPVPIKNSNGKIESKITAEKWKKSFEKRLLKKFIFEDTINNNL